MKVVEGDYYIEIVHTTDRAPCAVCITYMPRGVVVLDGTFANAMIASASLRDTLGHEPAISALSKLPLSPNSDLFDLNHDRPYAYLPTVETNLSIPDGWVPIDTHNYGHFSGGGNYVLCEHGHSKRLSLRSIVNESYGDEDSFEPTSYYDWLGIKGAGDQIFGRQSD